MSRKRASYPTKRTMNLFYKPDRTTKPATIALYILFGLVCILGLSYSNHSLQAFWRCSCA